MWACKVLRANRSIRARAFLNLRAKRNIGSCLVTSVVSSVSRNTTMSSRYSEAGSPARISPIWSAMIFCTKNNGAMGLPRGHAATCRRVVALAVSRDSWKRARPSAGAKALRMATCSLPSMLRMSRDARKPSAKPRQGPWELR